MLTLVDTSVAVPLILESHPQHGSARATLRGRELGLAGHAWFESFSVLTRLPSGQRRSPATAARLLTHNFPHTRFLDALASEALAAELANGTIAGGSVFDALIAAVARQHGAVLVSRDRRAQRTYEALGVELELMP